MKDLKRVEELLVVVDMVNGFIYEGNMKDEYISHIIPGIKETIKKFINKLDREIFFIRDCHKSDAKEFSKFPLHCLDNTSESEVVDEVKEYVSEAREYKKNSTSAMFARGLIEDLNEMENLKRIYVVGCCSDICVLNFALPVVNYFDELNKSVEVVVIEDLIETYDAPWHKRDEYNEMTYKLLKQAGVVLKSKEEVLNVEENKNVRK